MKGINYIHLVLKYLYNYIFRTSENSEGNIIYTPDAKDDFDEEDPDEDLCI